jgi:hypothetical protein
VFPKAVDPGNEKVRIFACGKGRNMTRNREKRDLYSVSATGGTAPPVAGTFYIIGTKAINIFDKMKQKLGSGKESEMKVAERAGSSYPEEWKKIVGASDKSQELVEHFKYLADTAGQEAA